jgi:NADP-dependent 3-hydroxy acid dehydrogenase YdfG
MSESLNDTVAIVTGASSGIGEASVRRLAAAGATVVLVARRADRLETLARTIISEGGKALAVGADIADAAQAQAVVAQALATFSRIDTLVNAAGVMLNGPSIDSPLAEWDHMVDTNLRGLMYMTKAALPHLLAAVKSSPRRVSDVVNISSVAGRFAAPQVAIYNATKFAVTAATESWRQEFTRRSLRFSVIEPGATQSELFDAKPGEWKRFTDHFGDVEKLHAEDIAHAVAYIVTSPRRVAINEIVVRPTDQP